MKRPVRAWTIAVAAVAAALGLVSSAAMQAAAQSSVPARMPAARPAPRTPDGKPDLSGVWGVVDRATGVDRIGGEESRVIYERYGRLPANEPIERTPWAQLRWEYNKDPRPGFGAREALDPGWKCIPHGPARQILGTSGEFVGGYEIIQSPRRVLIIYERHNQVRQIGMDGRGHPDPQELEHTHMGHSIGRWEGDTLVVDTVGILPDDWLDGAGNVYSKELRIEERYTRLDYETKRVEVTFHDPVALQKPLTRRMYRKLRDWDLFEDVRCWAGSRDQVNQEDLFTFDPQAQ